MPLDPKILFIAALLAGGYYVGDQAWHGLKKAGHAIVHLVHHDKPSDHNNGPYKP